jgi:hypothetical protein
MMNHNEFIIVHEFLLIDLGLSMMRLKHNMLHLARTYCNIIGSCGGMCVNMIIHDRGVTFSCSVCMSYNLAMLY